MDMLRNYLALVNILIINSSIVDRILLIVFTQNWISPGDMLDPRFDNDHRLNLRINPAIFPLKIPPKSPANASRLIIAVIDFCLVE